MRARARRIPPLSAWRARVHALWPLAVAAFGQALSHGVFAQTEVLDMLPPSWGRYVKGGSLLLAVILPGLLHAPGAPTAASTPNDGGAS